MNDEKGKGSNAFLKFLSFIFFLWFFYCALRAVLVFVHNSLGIRKLDYPYVSFIFVEVINPYLLFLFIMFLLQRGRWFFALYQKQNMTIVFVEHYFQPIIFGSVCFLFIVAPAFAFVLAAFSDHFYDTVTWLIPDTISLFLFLFTPFVLLSFVSSRSFRYHDDHKLAGLSLIGVSVTAILDFYAQLGGSFDRVFLDVMCKSHLGVLFFLFAAFFILTELMIRPYLDKAYRPHFTAFVFPICVVFFLLVDIILLEGFHVLCYDPQTEILP